MWEIGRFKLFLPRGNNTVHKFLHMSNTVCIQATCTVPTMHTICEGLHYCDAKDISLYYFPNAKLCAKHKKNTCEFHLYCWDHVCKVNEWCLLDCFHLKFRVSTQIMLHNYYITKCKKIFTIQNIYVNRNPAS